MKLNTSTNCQLVTPRLISLIPKTKPIVREETSFSPKTSFQTYSKANKTGSLVVEKSLDDIDMVLLQKIEHSIAGENISYRGFISSQLQRGPIDGAMNFGAQESGADQEDGQVVEHYDSG